MKQKADKRYVGAIDQGTTSSRFVVFDRQGEVVSSYQLEHRQIYPEPGHVEHDPVEIWNRVSECILGAMRRGGIHHREMAAVGVTNQRETVVVWNPKTGEPYHNAIVWQDARTADICRRLASEGGQDRFRNRTGLPLATYFSGPKILWFLERYPEIRRAAERGEAVAGNMDTWIIWQLTGGVRGGVHATDVTNASRTQLMNLATLDWDDDILAAMDIPRSLLPAIHPSSDPALYGWTTPDGPLGGAVPVSGDLGDQQAALFGHTCYGVGEAKNTYGTGCFLLLNTGGEIVHSRHGLLTTVGYKIGGEPAAYALEGSVAIAGSLVQWMRDNLRLIREPRRSTPWQHRQRTTAVSISSPPFQASLHPTGAATPGASSWGSPTTPPVPTWPGGPGGHGLPDQGDLRCHGEGLRYPPDDPEG
jgi:glycerol kinase